MCLYHVTYHIIHLFTYMPDTGMCNVHVGMGRDRVPHLLSEVPDLRALRPP